MRICLPCLTITAALATMCLSVSALAQEDDATAKVGDAQKTSDASKTGGAADSKASATSGEVPKAEWESRPPAGLPPDASATLARAVAAYDYGDMNQVVEAARPVAEGLSPASPEKQTQALRLLGIGLYLTNRQPGAQTAFTELLRRDPKARLDPTTTRPEVVAFFEDIRRKHFERQRSERRVIWNFIPPVGQFQNEDNLRGWIILGAGVLALGTAATSYGLLRSWHQPDHTYGSHQSLAQPLKTTNWISLGALAAIYVYGVFDGLIGYAKPLDDTHSTALRLRPTPDGIGFTF